MAWVKLDDQARQHRKLLAVGPTAAWLWVCGLMYCNAQKAHDGFIPSVAVPVLYPIPSWKKEVPKLVAAGLWEVVEGGYAVHDYHDYQPSLDVALTTSSARAAAGRLGGLRSGAARRSKPEATAEANLKQVASSKPEANSKQFALSKPKPVPIPSRPDPGLRDPPSGGGTTPRSDRANARGTRLPVDWSPTAATLQRFAEREHVDATASVERFKNYWLAKTGSAATKIDWDRTFVNWVLDDISKGKVPAFAGSQGELLSRRANWPPLPPEPSDDELATDDELAAFSEEFSSLERSAAMPEELRELIAADHGANR